MAQPGPGSSPLIAKGWEALVRDQDSAAIASFEQAYEQAQASKDHAQAAEALLHLGMAYYGMSHTQGLAYGFRALYEYRQLEPVNAVAARIGRSRSLQLLSTIYSRQGKYAEALAMSREALPGLPEKDPSGARGLVYSSIGYALEKLGKADSAAFYHQKALQFQLSAGNPAYLPPAYVAVADMELLHNEREASWRHHQSALRIADSMGNKQAVVIALLGLGRWQAKYHGADSAQAYIARAEAIAKRLNDRYFMLKVLGQETVLEKELGLLDRALLHEERASAIRDSLFDLEKQRLARSLDAQFEVSEKERELRLLQQEHRITLLSNSLLWTGLVFIVVLSAGVILFLRKIDIRNRQLLAAREELARASAEQAKMKEQFLSNEIEFRESQLSAMALQIMQKNALLDEIRAQLAAAGKKEEDSGLKNLLNRELNNDRDWADFNTSFERVNRNFYLKLKEACPDISPNDLKVCALIRLNLSIKEMAGILNISPDSVKTARYRLRKKLGLQTEDSLAGFIASL